MSWLFSLDKLAFIKQNIFVLELEITIIFNTTLCENYYY